MTLSLPRRRLLQAASALPMLGFPMIARAAGAKVIVIGGGFGGATAARYLKRADPSLQVTLIERDKSFITCPFSNGVIGGLWGMKRITHGYDAVRKRGISVAHDEVVKFDPAALKVTLKGGKTLAADRIIVAPGIDIRWGALAGYDEVAAKTMPHAWKAGAQTTLLRKQLEQMPDGGVVLMSAPANPFRCPPGPYERACMIGHHLKTRKPKSKLIILDAKDAISKQPLFVQAWEQLYKGIVEWVPLSKDGKVTRVDVKEMTLHTEFTTHKGAVVNVIPPQFAGKIARDAGLADQTGWCPVDAKTFESKLQKGVYVIGDAAIAGAMPKSGNAANSHGKVAAYAIAAALAGKPPVEPTLGNTCYSIAAPDYGFSVSDTYKVTAEGQIAPVKDSGGISPRGAPEAQYAQEARFAENWYKAITTEMFG
jgi:sulfide dehydrogenase [flavocytochrome c] flavoprotein subunit